MHIQWFTRTWRLLKNWPLLFMQKFRIPIYSKETPLKLRAGPIFFTARGGWGIDDLTAVWLDGVYGDLHELATVEHPIIIDIGAHIGTFAIYAALKSSTSTVYAFEPNPEVFKYLQKSVEGNHLESRVLPIEKAVAISDKNRTLFIDEVGGVSSSLFRRENRNLNEGVSVPCVTLRDIFKEYNITTCHLLKMNCEGAEYEILYNLPKELFNRIDLMVIQWHRVEKHSPQELERFLSQQGFLVTHAQAPYRFMYATRKQRVNYDNA